MDQKPLNIKCKDKDCRFEWNFLVDMRDMKKSLKIIYHIIAGWAKEEDLRFLEEFLKDDLEE